ncbi:aldo/keto reductase NDAI_0I01760 [Naumovozyma dairenensis CBS 421]|uniref:NADP-dependent oxidoreductase domain-containing protein n=1 Tax=Naumovozyma dairenensis (strain ATCC 10597 / BCRC 20456 / CBS 421 / NBRC 0211 / NRRL Y-12639) TaxID=1071378 RepID=G0WG34_NAUDC|nr:hypothetical protein NDAI_0I01760 [Naumovozyma dairenensis CBS 421]CCD26745.1 hypothetical protein NDAI_0I01760 [Naumovozyma dairenensis CBS 421]
MTIIKQVQFGNSGLKISPLIIGCMTFGSTKWNSWLMEDKQEVFRLLKYCYDQGLRTFDTADQYSNGQSERILGEFLRFYNIKRETVVIMTKIFFEVDETLDVPQSIKTANDEIKLAVVNQRGLSRKHIIAGVSNSCDRLGTYIDVLQIHRYDPETPMEETMRALNDVINSGEVRYIGASRMLATQFAEYQFIAGKNGWHKFVNWQSQYNLLYREDEREVIPFAKRHNIALTPYSPNAKGILTRPWGSSTERTGKGDPRLKMLMKCDREIVERVRQLADRKNVSMAQISLSWILHKGCYPIIGVNSIPRVQEAVVALQELSLSSEDISFLEEPYTPHKLV